MVMMMIVTVLAMIAVMVVIIMSVVTGTDPAVIGTHTSFCHHHCRCRSPYHHDHQMGAGAEEAGITLQYCMSLPRSQHLHLVSRMISGNMETITIILITNIREVLQSSAVSAARRLRASGDYILSKVFPTFVFFVFLSIFHTCHLQYLLI